MQSSTAVYSVAHDATLFPAIVEEADDVAGNCAAGSAQCRQIGGAAGAGGGFDIVQQ